MVGLDALMAEHPLFAGLDGRALTLMAGCARNLPFKAGSYLLHEGDPADQFYLIRRGSVALECFAPGRGAVIFETLKKGDLLGLSWLAPPYRSQFDARVLEPLQALVFDAACLRNKCEADHHLGYELMKRFVPAMVRRLQAARIRMMDLYGNPAVGGLATGSGR
ncbi:MAG: cyclic nucleotide-binding domain-containing protein [Candidatus Competibacterales bacterium]